MPTTPTPADRPDNVLRGAAELLREAAGHATPGPCRTHDTHLGGVGSHTATVLTDRPNLNDTELIAWLPTMSHEPWDETRNAWRKAGWMALMHPGVGLALAAWLEGWAGVGLSEYGPMPEDAQHALTVARQLLGTTKGEGRPSAAAAPLAEVWTVWRKDEPVYAHYTTEDDAKQGTIDCWQEDEPSCPDYSWRKDGPRLELLVGGEFGGIYASRHRVYGAPPAPADRATASNSLRARFEALAAEWEKRGKYGDSGITDRARELRAVLADEAAAGVQPPTKDEVHVTAERDCLAMAVMFALQRNPDAPMSLRDGIEEILATMPARSEPAAPAATKEQQ